MPSIYAFMWIRYAVAIAGEIIWEDARMTAKISKIITSKISLHFWDHWNHGDSIAMSVKVEGGLCPVFSIGLP